VQAELNLGYTTIKSPVTGASSFAKKQVGSYIGPGADSLLTYVAALDPIRIDFSVSENQYLGYASDTAAGRIRAPETRALEVEIELADGSIFASRGRMTFADAAFSTETGTYLIRAEIPNPERLLRPGQFVRARLIGAVRPNAVIVPQRAVMQTSRGSFVWVLAEDGTARQQPVVTGDLLGNDWLIERGLQGGEQVVVDGAIKVQPGMPLKVEPMPATAEAAVGAR
jgi:membrane fusion protein (multidrug efflux system)